MSCAWGEGAGFAARDQVNINSYNKVRANEQTKHFLLILLGAPSMKNQCLGQQYHYVL